MAIVASIDVLLGAKTDKFEKGMSRAQKTTRALTTAFGTLGLTIGAGEVFRRATTSVLEFQRAMAKSTAIMGDLTDKMRGDLASAARAVAKETKFSSAEAAESYFFLASAGLDAEQSIAALPQVAKFAQAGMFDMALATDLATDAQSALGLTTKDAQQNLQNLTRVTDVLVKGNTIANASVQQFSEAITNKAGVAMRQLGIDMEEGVAVLAAYADQGVKAAEAGTAFGIIVRDLTTKALQNEEAFRQARIAVFDSQGEFRNMGDIIADVERKLDGMSDAQQKATLLNLGFSDKSVSYISSLIGMSEKIRKYEQDLRSANGVTDEIAKKTITTFDDAIHKLGETFDSFADNKLTPLIDRFTVLADLIEKVGSAASSVDKKLGDTGLLGTAVSATKPGFLTDVVTGNRDIATPIKDTFDKLFGFGFDIGTNLRTGGKLNTQFARAVTQEESPGPRGMMAGVLGAQIRFATSKGTFGNALKSVGDIASDLQKSSRRQLLGSFLSGVGRDTGIVRQRQLEKNRQDRLDRIDMQTRGAVDNVQSDLARRVRQLQFASATPGPGALERGSQAAFAATLNKRQAEIDEKILIEERKAREAIERIERQGVLLKKAELN